MGGFCILPFISAIYLFDFLLPGTGNYLWQDDIIPKSKKYGSFIVKTMVLYRSYITTGTAYCLYLIQQILKCEFVDSGNNNYSGYVILIGWYFFIDNIIKRRNI
ncbi:hypothetical protein BH10BAC3_BH10BAC3_14780 [soil metagenome]